MTAANSRPRFRRRLNIPPTDPDIQAFYEWAKEQARIRMAVFDVAPPEVRDEVNYYPSNDGGVASQALKRWWRHQTEWDFDADKQLIPYKPFRW